MDCVQTQTLIQGYIDNELDVLSAATIERHLEGCAACDRVYAEQKAVQSAIRSHADYFSAPPGLRADLRALLRGGDKPKTGLRAFPWTWPNLGAALTLVAALVYGVILYLAVPSGAEQLTQALVSSHIRSLMVNHLADVASSDQHTVKPWFNGKLDFSPPVNDLTAQGFPLVGGRLDYLDNRPVAALIYRRRQHFINLFIWPDGPDKRVSREMFSKQGYNLMQEVRGGMAFWAVSDLNRDELTEFMGILLAKAGS